MATSDWLRSRRTEESGDPAPAEASRADAAIKVSREFCDLVQEIEAHLRDIDFDEVTIEDRVTYVEYAVAWRMRLAIRRGRPDLAVCLQHYGRRRIAQLQDESSPEASADEMLVIPHRPRSNE